MKKLLSLALAMLMLLSLAACGGKDKAPESAAGQTGAATQTPATEPAPAAKDSPAGYYKMTGYVADGEETDLSELEALGLIFYLVLNEDGTGFMDMAGDQDNLKWDDKNFTDDEGATSPYTYANGVITVTDSDGGEMTFARLTDAELAYYKENGSGSFDNLFGSGETFENEGEVSDYYVKFVGAEAIESDDGEPAIRVWYDFTNNSDKVASPWRALSVYAEQGEEMLDLTYLYDDVPEASNDSFGVAPGYTARCAESYLYDPAGGDITATISEFFGNSVVCTLDPEALPGAPADDGPAWEADPAMPAYMAGVPETDGSMEILGYVTDVDWDGEDVVIVRFRFTNNTDEETSAFINYNIYCMQDGFGLEESNSDAYSEEQSNVFEDVAPGESIECACTFLLRTGDPFAVVLEGTFTDDYFGQAFELSFG